jgi:hypothetical protein
MAYALTRTEQETVIRWDALTKTAVIDTATPEVIRKMDKLAGQFPGVYKVVRVDPNYSAKRYEVDARYVRFGRPASEAQRNAARINSKLKSPTKNGDEKDLHPVGR